MYQKVIDGQLFEAFFDNTGDVRIEEIQSGTLVWRNPAAGMVHSIITIATFDQVPKMVEQAMITSRALLEKKDAFEAAMKHLRE